jgi:hypothetical protein
MGPRMQPSALCQGNDKGGEGPELCVPVVVWLWWGEVLGAGRKCDGLSILALQESTPQCPVSLDPHVLSDPQDPPPLSRLPPTHPAQLTRCRITDSIDAMSRHLSVAPTPGPPGAWGWHRAATVRSRNRSRPRAPRTTASALTRASVTRPAARWAWHVARPYSTCACQRGECACVCVCVHKAHNAP